MTEKHLRERIESLYLIFPQDYVRLVCAKPEQEIIDDRLVTECKNRRLDLIVRSSTSGKPIPIEYKRGNLTEELVVECIFRRGYIELCHKHLPGFETFVFVAEHIDTQAEKLCAKLSQNKDGYSIITRTYTKMAQNMVSHYLFWAKQNRSRGSALKVLAACSEALPFWLDEAWLEAVATQFLVG